MHVYSLQKIKVKQYPIFWFCTVYQVAYHFSLLMVGLFYKYVLLCLYYYSDSNFVIAIFNIWLTFSSLLLWFVSFTHVCHLLTNDHLDTDDQLVRKANVPTSLSYQDQQDPPWFSPDKAVTVTTYWITTLAK